MKKINSIEYGHRILGGTAIFLIVIPAALYAIEHIVQDKILFLCGKVSVTIGLGITVFLFILLSIEFHQDRKMYKKDKSNKNERHLLKTGFYECQMCGNRQVKSSDSYCRACGIKFRSGVAVVTKILVSDLPKVSETLLIPLVVKAKEAAHNEPIFVDKKSVEILDKIDTGDIIIDGGSISTHGILARTRVIDSGVKELLDQNPKATIINLGAGLDTRMSRLDNGELRWYDLDLKEVIQLRRRFFEESERIFFIESSVMDFSWIGKIVLSPGETIIIIAEGLMMYFSESDIKQLLSQISTRFPKAHMFFDVVHPYFVGKGINSTFQWGIAGAKDIYRLSDSVYLIHSWSTGNLLKSRQPFFLRLMNVLPSTRNRSQVLHIQF
jgi:O-methyltransferase involved in polyketide biosynthesis